MTDSITIMATLDGSPVAKTVTAQGVEPAAQHMWFQAHEHALASFEDLVMVLDILLDQPAMFVVRGKPLPHTDQAKMRRTHVNEPSLGACEHQWLLLDLDSWMPHIPAHAFASNPALYATQARDALPSAFRRARVYWLATSSAGLKSGVRLRLGFWLSRPVGDREAKSLAEHMGIENDLALFTPSQPHYTSRPLLAPGVADPVPGPRSGVLDGMPQVELADIPKDLSGALGALALAVRKVRKTEPGERRTALNQHAYYLACKYAPEDLPPDKITQALLEACEDNGLPGSEALKTLQDSIRDGHKKHIANRAGWRERLARDDKTDKALSTQANVTIYLECHEVFTGRLAYDERANRPIWTLPPPWDQDQNYPRPITATDDTRAVEWFQEQAYIQAKPHWVSAGLVKASELRRFDPIQEYLLGLPKWDGEHRLDTFFIRHLGVADTELTQAQSRCWFVQAALRAFATLTNPVQADYLIALIGKQGIRKSSTLRELCPHPSYFTDTLPHLSSADAAIAVSQAWLVELSEMTGTKADRDTVKAFLTRRVDKFRKPYGRDQIEAPRRAVFAATTNEDEPLTDPSGNRRYWPMVCTRRPDMNEIAQERDQLWAEAYERAIAGEHAYLGDELETKAQEVQEAHVEQDPVKDLVREILVNPQLGGLFGQTEWKPGQLNETKHIARARTTQILDLLRENKTSLVMQLRVRKALKALGWTERRGTHERYWTPPKGWEYEHASKEARN